MLIIFFQRKETILATNPVKLTFDNKPLPATFHVPSVQFPKLFLMQRLLLLVLAVSERKYEPLLNHNQTHAKSSFW
jgi:hypothetical protein